jgi:hypothetical protein
MIIDIKILAGRYVVAFVLTIIDVVLVEDVLFVIMLVMSFGGRNDDRSNGLAMTMGIRNLRIVML